LKNVNQKALNSIEDANAEEKKMKPLKDRHDIPMQKL
jgi:hypothetical protein